ncbi:MAG: response regulator [Clostridiales bacterium]|jgi:two-component system response regulator YesN|nr:response regulator [Clostridiales bacterium]
MRIYIADDDRLVRQGLSAMILRDLSDVEIVGEAASGQAAIAEISALMPDVVITDVKMPDIDGVQLTALITKLGGGIRTIILSGHNDYDYVRQSMKNGAIDYLLKPVIKTELFSLLRSIQSHPGEHTFQHSKEIPSNVKNAQNYIKQHYAEKLTLEIVANSVHLHPSYLSELFTTHIGTSFSAYTMEIRIDRAKELLLGTQYKISSICEMVGYDMMSFSRAFKHITGVSPAQYRKSRGGIADNK